MWKESLIHWSLELLLGAGRGNDEGCCERTFSSTSSSSSSSSSEYPLSPLNEASDKSEEPLYSWMASWRDHNWHTRDMSSWRRPTCTQTQNICSGYEVWYNLEWELTFSIHWEISSKRTFNVSDEKLNPQVSFCTNMYSKAYFELI